MFNPLKNPAHLDRVYLGMAQVKALSRRLSGVSGHSILNAAMLPLLFAMPFLNSLKHDLVS